MENATIGIGEISCTLGILSSILQKNDNLPVLYLVWVLQYDILYRQIPHQKRCIDYFGRFNVETIMFILSITRNAL